MRAFAIWAFAIGLFAVPAIAAGQTGGGDSRATITDSAAEHPRADVPAKTPKTGSAKANPDSTAVTTEAEPRALDSTLRQLRSLIEIQAKQLQEQNEQLKLQQDQLDRLEDQLKRLIAEKSAADALSFPSPVHNASNQKLASAAGPTTIPAPDGTVAPENRRATAKAVSSASGNGERVSNAPESPLQFRIGSAYITPVGFMDLTGVWRSRNAGSGIGTNFAGIPYGGASVFQTNLSELRFSMQNSRIGFRVDANVKGAHVIGYMEADFVGNNAGNVAVTSNSNTMRSRLYWVDLRKGPWEALAGQTWSLATANRSGVSPLPGDIFLSNNMDVNYQLGMVWGRIPELRLAYHFPRDKAAWAIAVDSPDQYMGGANGSAAATLPTCCSYYAGGELDNGTTALSPPNRAPDIISKFVFDPSMRFHGEVGGIARFFQLYEQTAAATYTAVGGAGFLNLDFGITRQLRLLTHNYWSDGGGRYIFGQAPDLIVRPDGTPSLLHSGSSVDGFEFAHRNMAVGAYYGLVYVDRNVEIDTTGQPIGWGYAGSPSGDNRTIQEGTFDFIQNFWKSPSYGALTLISQYSYLTRSPWSVAVGNPANAHANIVFVNLRYTLPGSAPTFGEPGKQ